MRPKREESAKETAARPTLPVEGLGGLADLGLPKIEPPADKPRPKGDFAEVDEEIERLEQTQKILNAILDRLMTKEKGKEKER